MERIGEGEVVKTGEALADRRLSERLAEWKAIVPSDGFERAVWRRIRTVPVSNAPAVRWAAGFRAWVAEQAIWASAVAAAAGIVVGVWAGMMPSRAHAARQHGEALLHGQTLAGSYLALSPGGSR